MVYGFYFNNYSNFNISQDTLTFNFNYHNGTDWLYSNRLISKTIFENSDTVLFETPLTIDILNLDIRDAKKQIIVSLSEENAILNFFHTNFSVEDAYYVDRVEENPNLI